MKRLKLIGIGTKPDYNEETMEWLSASFLVTVEQDFGDKKRIGITLKMSPQALEIVPQLKSEELETYATYFEKRTRKALESIAKSYGEVDNIEQIVDVVRLKAPLLVRKASGMHMFNQSFITGKIIDSEQFFKDAGAASKCKDGMTNKIIEFV